MKWGSLTYERLITRELGSLAEPEEGLEADRPLTLYSYSLDTFALLVMPMVRDR